MRMHEVADLRCSVLIWVGIVWVIGWVAPVSAQQLPVTITPGPPPEPPRRVVQPPFALELFFDDLPQGGVGLVRVLGEGLRSLTLRVFDEEWAGFAVGDAHYALLAVHYSQGARGYRLTAQIEDTRGIFHVIEADFRVTVGNFIRSEATMPYERAALLDPELEQEEAALLRELIAPVTEPAWLRLQLPLDRPLSSPFGEFRRFNEEHLTRHTGWDFRATIGTPVAAMAGGRVAYSGWLVLRGNYVLIDHGAGMYSGYAHLSQAHVVRGQRIHPGQIIGRVGNSGRSTAAHLHWDAALHGRWVDGVALVGMWLPGP
ncbi:MAG: M23 family metallopeptidase [Chloroflexi bacterium]|nr:M23 family metallopeptidase [Chloroflexota bacterium]